MKLYRCGKNGVNKTPGGDAGSAPRTSRGVLYLVAVPIGHPDDLTLRARRILRAVDLIASERPESTQRLLAHHGIKAVVTSYGPAHLKDKIAVLMARLQQGAHIALVSDCGTPVVADPGCLLVASAHAGGVPVVSIPGPSALTAAVAASGLACDSLFFGGPLPRTTRDITRCLTGRLSDTTPTVLFCTPSSIAEALRTIARLAPRRRIVLACDLTTPAELIIRGTARQAQRRLEDLLSARDITLMWAGRRLGGEGRKARP